MKLLLDLQALQNESRNRGIGRYVKSLFDALARRNDIELFGLINGGMQGTSPAALDYIAKTIRPERVLTYPGLGETQLQNPGNWNRWRLSQAAYEAFIADSGCDALLVGSLVEGFIDNTSISLTAPAAPYLKAAILYDLIPLMDIEKYLPWDKAREWYFDRMRHLEAADLALTISDSSRRECLEYLNFDGDTAITISTAVDPAIFHVAPPAAPELLASLGITKPFVMHTSAIEPRKNFDGLVKSFASLPPETRRQHQLVLVGHSAETERKRLLSLARKVGLGKNDVVMPGFVADRDLAQLYRSCRLFVFPSLHEGFGLPALEAMACGCPTIGSNTTSIPEVIGKDDYQFDPYDSAAITRLMQRLLTNESEWQSARSHALTQARRFSWDQVADRAIEAMRSALAQRSEYSPRFPSATRMSRHVVGRVGMQACPDNDLLLLARCLAAAEDELVTKTAANFRKPSKAWRIEGPFDSSYSLALVNRETARAMTSLGWNVTLHSTEGPGDFLANADFLSLNPDLAAMNKRANETTQETSFATSRLLYPPRVRDMNAPINALHHYAWEESGIPHGWVDDFNSNLTFMTALSSHVEKIMIDNGLSIPLITSGCGVDHWDRIETDPGYKANGRGFRFLHVSSCFPRKGVDALLRAYGAAFSIDDDVSLVIKTFDNPHNEVRAKLAELQAQNSRYPHVDLIFADLNDGELKSLYSQCHVLVGPSLAEGYGLPFAEAFLSGIPVITTAWGGQLDFCNASNSWLVDYRFARARTHFGLWASAWAEVDVPSLAQAMRDAHATPTSARDQMASNGRSQLMARHQWRHVAERLTVAGSTLPRSRNRDPRIGWISTWHSKCGIASYSRHLIDHMPEQITIFSPANETRLLGEDISVRTWHQSKSSSHLWRVLTSPNAQDLDIFVIQFNYGFFNHTDLARFIEQAKALGKAIVICLHSTVDPQDEVDIANFHLGAMVTSLSACDRILVHSIADLNRLKQLGLVNNVALFPHGVLRRGDALPARTVPQIPTIATYGFALPHKGLTEALHAVRILHDYGRPVRLRMVNAEYPLQVSAKLIQTLHENVRQLDLTDYVEIKSGYLSDAESLTLLTDSDLIVFPYQKTAESASGAVRFGMAVERPVAVTPLPIFSDLDGATFVFSGTSPANLASGITLALDAIAQNDRHAASVAEQANRWRAQHDYGVVGKRLFNMCKALVNRT